eukprot:355515-Chlamydomonas_euryale.AAC.16
MRCQSCRAAAAQAAPPTPPAPPPGRAHRRGKACAAGCTPPAASCRLRKSGYRPRRRREAQGETRNVALRDAFRAEHGLGRRKTVHTTKCLAISIQWQAGGMRLVQRQLCTVTGRRIGLQPPHQARYTLVHYLIEFPTGALEAHAHMSTLNRRKAGWGSVHGMIV